ncbi:MAG: ribonuclease HII [Nitrospirales bacterium]|nr:ribonuclease HII [Nitrospira sp.]MDR4501675.1 ribonuclease HII [Nitrospirales bacterium]
MQPDHFFEDAAHSCGHRSIAGLDEAGRGPLAGPVVASAVLLPRRFRLEGLNDSKVLHESDRESLYGQLTHRAISWSIGIASEQEIDRLNILEATRLALFRALTALSITPDYLLTDAIHVPYTSIPQRSIIKGDGLSLSIAAASVLAKVTRDRVMHDYHQRFPQYQFHIHKGYPTPQHLRLLAEHGPCQGHRQSFRPVQACRSLVSEPA